MKKTLKAVLLAALCLPLMPVLEAAAAPYSAEVAPTGIYKPLHYGHVQHSGRNTASFGVFHTDYDDYTSPFYYEAAFTEHLKDRNFTAPVLKAGVDENYWNAGVSMQYGSVYGAITYYNAIANFQNWPANMTDLGLAGTFAFGSHFSAQARYYDFCISGGIGMAMPGLTLAAKFGNGDYKVRLAAGCDICLWHLGPWGNDKYFPRLQGSIDYSRDSMRGFGVSYLGVPAFDGPGSTVSIDDVAMSHTISFWGGVAKDLGRYTVGLRPNGFVSLNAVNPTAVRYWELLEEDGAMGIKKKLTEWWHLPHRLGEYNPYADDGNLEALIRLPVALSCRISEYVTVTGGVQFGLYYANFDHYGYTGLGGDNGKGWVPEVGASLGLSFEMGGASLSVGSSFIRAPSLDRDKYGNTEKYSNQFWRHSYYAEDLSLGSLVSSPLTVSLRFRF